MSVTTLKDANQEPNKHVVHVCKLLLEKAESGELRDVAVCGLTVGHRVYTNWSTSDYMIMVGQLELLKHMMLSEMDKIKIDS